MEIAVIGAGQVGATLAAGWTKAGHQLVFGARDPGGERVRQAIERCGPQARAASLADTAQASDVIVIATPWGSLAEVIEQLGDLNQKIVIDCINPLNADLSGLDLGGASSVAERIAELAAGAKVVKAFNTASVRTMADPIYEGHSATMFFCGDDAEAKQTVSELVEQLGFEPVDAGPLRMACHLESLAMLYIHLAVHQKMGSNCAFKLLRRVVK